MFIYVIQRGTNYWIWWMDEYGCAEGKPVIRDCFFQSENIQKCIHPVAQ
jgi:hypothetical protein